MTIEEYWDKLRSMTETERAEAFMEILKAGFSEEIQEMYETEEDTIEVMAHYEYLKQYDILEELSTILQEKYPILCANVHPILSEILNVYYCFRDNKEKLEWNVKELEKADKDGFFLLGQVLEKIAYYGHFDIVDASLERIFSKRSSPDEELTFMLMNLKYLVEFEKFYKAGDERNWEDFVHRMSGYGFDIQEDYSAIARQVFSSPTTEYAQKLLANHTIARDKNYVIVSLGLLFQIEMLEKGMSFIVSNFIWDRFSTYLEDIKYKDWETYFLLQEKSLRKFLQQEMYIEFNATTECILLWGGSYLIEFIRAHGIFDEENYSKQKHLIDTLKNEFKQKHVFHLWKCSFVHRWLPVHNSDTITEEKEEFEKSFALKKNPVKVPHTPFDLGIPANEDTAPVVSTKIGRNEKVTVRYQDGTVKENVKYKQVMNDLKEGKCELL